MNKLQQLLDAASLYEPPVPEGEDVIVLDSEDVDVVTAKYVEQSDVSYVYNSFDDISIFKGGKYQRVPDANEIRLYIRKFLGKCKILKKKKGLVPFSRKTKGFISDLIETLCSLPDVHLLPGQKAPCSLDGKLDTQTIIAANNCLISIKEYPFMTHPITKQFYTHNYLDYDYDKDAYSELWNKFIVEITVGDLDMALLLQQWAGYLLLPTLKYQKFLLCIGDGANGKGVFFDTIAAALGKENVSNVPLVRFIDKHTLFGTYGKMVNMSNENTQDLESAAEGVIKEYVAGDKVLWEQKYKDPFFAYPTAKLMFATNELPRIRDDSDGIWRRMILVPFKGKFMGKDQDLDLAKKLQQPDNLAGILNWMLKGAVSLMVNDGFVASETAKRELDNYRRESHPEIEFLEENFETCDVENTLLAVPCKVFRKAYEDWCRHRGVGIKGDRRLKQAMKKIFPNHKREQVRRGDKRPYYYLGVMMSVGSEFYLENCSA